MAENTIIWYVLKCIVLYDPFSWMNMISNTECFVKSFGDLMFSHFFLQRKTRGSSLIYHHLPFEIAGVLHFNKFLFSLSLFPQLFQVRDIGLNSMLFLLTTRVTSMSLLTSMFCTHMRHQKYSFFQDKETFHDMDEHILHIHLAHRCSTITTKITASFDKLYIVFPLEFTGITSFWRDSKNLWVWS